MEDETETCSVNPPLESSNLDELFMKQSLLFADSLKDLKNLRKQLYSAAEYFESSYHKDDRKQLVVETAKDYVTKALISAVDHLGSVASKVENFLDEKLDQVSGTRLRFSCIEQRLRTSQEFINRCGLSQQSILIASPKYHKRYIIPAGDNNQTVGQNKSIRNSNSFLRPEDDLNQPKNIRCTTGTPASHVYRGNSFRKEHFKLLSAESLSSPGSFSFRRLSSNREQGKRAVSPIRFPFMRSGSVTNNRSVSPRSSKMRWPSEPGRSISMCIYPERERTKEIDQHHCNKNKRLFKALFSIYRSRKETEPTTEWTRWP